MWRGFNSLGEMHRSLSVSFMENAYSPCPPCSTCAIAIVHALCVGDLQKVKVASVDFSNTSNLIFIFEEGISDTNMWPRKHTVNIIICSFVATVPQVPKH